MPDKNQPTRCRVGIVRDESLTFTISDSRDADFHVMLDDDWIRIFKAIERKYWKMQSVLDDEWYKCLKRQNGRAKRCSKK